MKSENSLSEKAFDLSYLLAEEGCSDKVIEKALDELFKIFRGEKRRAIVKCNGKKLVIEKKRFGLDFYFID